MDDDEFEDIANKALMKMREVLGQSAAVHVDMPYTILVALLAECALLADDPNAFLSEFLSAVHECSTQKVDLLIRESAIATHH